MIRKPWTFGADGCWDQCQANHPRRQALPVAFHREGSVYVTRRSILMEGNSLYGTKVLGYQIKSLSSLNIDTQDDWEAAEQLFVGGLVC